MPTSSHVLRRLTLRRLLPAAALAALLGGAAPASAQSLPEFLGAMRQGGGWITLPIVKGKGTLLTTPMPTAGLRLRGCMEIWGGHSGTFAVRIEDTYGNGRLLRQRARPAEDVPFVYNTGQWAQLDVNVEWSEPRDTTLIVWVGLEGNSRRDPCEPVYSGN